jgi:hypothetical protein
MEEVKTFKFTLRRKDAPELYDYLNSLKSGKVSANIRNLVIDGYDKGVIFNGLAQLIEDKLPEQPNQTSKKSHEELYLFLNNKLSTIEDLLNELVQDVLKLQSLQGKSIEPRMDKAKEPKSDSLPRFDNLRKSANKFTSNLKRGE